MQNVNLGNTARTFFNLRMNLAATLLATTCPGAIAQEPVAQPAPTNYDEAKVGAYELPDPFVGLDHQPVRTPQDWWSKRRPEILGLYRKYIFGVSPPAPAASDLRCEVLGRSQLDRSRRIRLQRYRLWLKGVPRPLTEIAVFTPANAAGPVPAFVSPNFLGNQSITKQFDIPVTKSWVSPHPEIGIDQNGRAGPASRGAQASRWPLAAITGHGYGLVSFYYGDLYPDHAGGRDASIQPYFGPGRGTSYSWGAIATWAWGMSRALDCAERIPALDASRVIAIGHSRLGKTALWAAAQDTRFAAAISNDSGEGGAAISRRNYGERVADLENKFPYWFSANFARFSGKERQLPVDSNLLLGLIAPRPLYVASAQDDRWSDPLGEFEGLVAASKIYEFLGYSGIGTHIMPSVNRPVSGRLSYHIRSGKHDINEYDWDQFLRFADMQVVLGRSH
jgi:hypothetical protein